MKKFVSVLVIAVMLFSLAGCTKTTTISIRFRDVDDFTIVKIPEGFKNLSTVEDTIKLTVNKEGEYPFVIETDDGAQHSFTVKYEKGTATVIADDLSVIAGLE